MDGQKSSRRGTPKGKRTSKPTKRYPKFAQRQRSRNPLESPTQREMARAIGCGLSSGVLLAEKSALLGSPVVKAIAKTVSFPLKSGGSGGRVAACAASTTRKPRGIMVPQRISPALQELLGVPEIARTQALKLIWAHIKSNNLQDPNNKKIVVCDEKLKKVFGKDRVGFLEISGLITPHFPPKSKG